MGEQYRVFGALKSPEDKRDFVLPVAAFAEELPARYIAPLVPVDDQGNVGACVIFAVNSLLAQKHVAQGEGYIPLSAGFGYGHKTSIVIGSYPREIFSNYQKYGVPTRAEYAKYFEKMGIIDTVEADVKADPSLLDKAAKNRFDRYYTVGISANAIKAAVWKVKGYVSFAWAVSGYLLLDKSGCIIRSTGEITGLHMMNVVGWDDNYCGGAVRIQNSWNTTWGDKGFAWIKYSDIVPYAGAIEGVAEVWCGEVDPPKQTLKMKIGSKSYELDGVRHDMDVACYLDENDRTMVPIRFVSQAMGVAEEDVIWHPYYYGVPRKLYPAQSWVQIIDRKYGTDIRFTIDSLAYVRQVGADASSFLMDTTPVYDDKAGRVYVPVRYIVNALQGLIEWDESKPNDITIKF